MTTHHSQASLTAQQALTNARRIVVKIGTESIISNGNVAMTWLMNLAEDVALLKSFGKEVILVSSGAIGLGRGETGLHIDPSIPTKDLPLRTQQIASTIGQTRLMAAYRQALSHYGLIEQQILITRDVVDNDVQVANLRAACLQQDGDDVYMMARVPVINEDDALATEEITFGDNDGLSATVTELFQADLLTILSKQKGLFTDNPDINPHATLIPYVPDVSSVMGLANDHLNGLSRGGMVSKLRATYQAAASGATVILAQGMGEHHPLARLLRGDPTFPSTVFAPIAK